MQREVGDIIIYILVPTLLILSWVGFTVGILYLYQKKQIAFLKSLEKLKHDHEKNLLKTRLEIQEQTFQNISREIHDNIGLSLTLAKLNLNILDLSNLEKAEELVRSTVELIGKSINDLSDISKSLNSEAFSEQGLTNALQVEISRLKKLNHFSIDFQIRGTPVYFNAQKELILFRIAQEALNNVIKHARAKNIIMELNFEKHEVTLSIKDNGQGFYYVRNAKKFDTNFNAGLINMQIRSALINGKMEIQSEVGKGTTVIVIAPIDPTEN